MPYIVRIIPCEDEDIELPIKYEISERDKAMSKEQRKEHYRKLKERLDFIRQNR